MAVINVELICLWGKLSFIYTCLSGCVYFCHTILFSVNYTFIKTSLKVKADNYWKNTVFRLVCLWLNDSRWYESQLDVSIGDNEASFSQVWNTESSETDRIIKWTIAFLLCCYYLRQKSHATSHSCYCPYSSRHWRMPVEMHCLLLQPLISNYKMPNLILSGSLSYRSTARLFMLHSASPSQAISPIA